MDNCEINDPFIYINKNSISKILCKEIISKFEDNEQIKVNGLVGSGFRPDIRNTFALDIDKKSVKWIKIYNFLFKELSRNIHKYMKFIDKDFNDNVISNNLCPGFFLQFDDFIIQKYLKNEGFYINHNDFLCDYFLKRYRLFSYIFYLNDVIEGGETEFYNGKYKIKPESGKLVIFPSSWTYPHCGKMPLSSHKYIITGWIYCNENKYVINKVNQISDYMNTNKFSNIISNDNEDNRIINNTKTNIEIPKYL